MNQIIHPPAAAGKTDDIALQRIHASVLTYDDICRPVVRSFRKCDGLRNAAEVQ